jgi:hypothetical protein
MPRCDKLIPLRVVGNHSETDAASPGTGTRQSMTTLQGADPAFASRTPRLAILKPSPLLQLAPLLTMRIPVFFVQPENDYDLSPTRILSAAMKDSGKVFQVKVYPPFGKLQKRGIVSRTREACLSG